MGSERHVPPPRLVYLGRGDESVRVGWHEVNRLVVAVLAGRGLMALIEDLSPPGRVGVIMFLTWTVMLVIGLWRGLSTR